MFLSMYICMYFNLLCFRSNGRHDRPESEIEKYVEKMTDLEEKYEVIHFASHCVYYHTYSEQTSFFLKKYQQHSFSWSRAFGGKRPMWPPNCETLTNYKMYVYRYLRNVTVSHLWNAHIYVIHEYVYFIICNYSNQIGRLCQDSALERQIHEILSKL